MNKSYLYPKNVLIVEDDPSICSWCMRILSDEGFDVDVAKNGSTALDMIEKNRYDLCLIDLQTPEMIGTELYMWMEENHPSLANRVIFTTGIQGSELDEFLDQVKKPILPKSFTSGEFKNALNITLNQTSY